MYYARQGHTAVLIDDKVLVVGGYDGNTYLNSAELYDPSAGTWALTSTMNYARHSHTVSVLGDGKVLVTGGQINNVQLNSAELYDPSTNRWTITGNMNHA
jgi:N-acetylneuraminic acid mutarotase